MTTINVYLSPNINNMVNPIWKARSEMVGDFEANTESNDLKEIKKEIKSQLMRARQLFRENGLKIPQKLNSAFKIQLYMKDYMIGGKYERTLIQTKEENDTEIQKRTRRQAKKA